MSEVLLRPFRKKFTTLLTDSEHSQSAISRAIGIPQSSLSNWARGISEPGLSSVLKLAKFFNVPLSELAGEGEQIDAPQLHLPIDAQLGRVVRLLAALDEAELSAVLDFVSTLSGGAPATGHSSRAKVKHSPK